MDFSDLCEVHAVDDPRMFRSDAEKWFVDDSDSDDA